MSSGCGLGGAHALGGLSGNILAPKPRGPEYFHDIGGLGNLRFPGGPRGPKADDARVLADAVGRLAALQDRLGGLFSIENPRRSRLWSYHSIAPLVEQHHMVKFDQCMFGLQIFGELPENPARVKKPTSLLTSVKELEVLSSKCNSQHEHRACLGIAVVAGRRVSVATEAGR